MSTRRVSKHLRGLIAVTSIILFAFAAPPVAATAQPSARPQGDPTQIEYGDPPKTVQKAWLAWAFGSDTNPLFDSTLCGEMVGKRFFLNATIVPLMEADCEIEHGVPLVATPGGGVDWKSSDATTNKVLIASRDADFATVCCPFAWLDGTPIDLDPGFAKTGVYTIAVGESSFIRTVDPTFPAGWTETQVASAGWFFRIVHLSRGTHELVLKDELGGQTLEARFHITVV
jgi:hypothetical protein